MPELCYAYITKFDLLTPTVCISSLNLTQNHYSTGTQLQIRFQHDDMSGVKVSHVLSPRSFLTKILYEFLGPMHATCYINLILDLIILIYLMNHINSKVLH
jgi:hypothetical protein